MNISIGVIVVLYNKDFSGYHLNFEPLTMIVVDNTENRDLALDENDLIYIPLKKNAGIAAAQNVGIKKALEIGCTHVLFFDQDTIVSSDYVEKLVNEYMGIERWLPNLFLLGPKMIEQNSNQEYKSYIHKDKKLSETFSPKREIISSGSLTSLEKIKKVGYLDEKLFIDYVDFEWCWRANALGMVSGVTNTIFLKHQVGLKMVNMFFYQMIISSPFRYYYQTRNSIWLSSRSYVPFMWKINKLVKTVISFIYFLLHKDMCQNITYIFKGIRAGFKKQES